MMNPPVTDALPMIELPVVTDEPLGRRGAGPQRRRAADEGLLERGVALGEQVARERRAVAEAPEQRALADPRLGGDRVHRRAAHAALGEQLLRRGEDAPPVARRVRALGRLVGDERELD